MPSFAQASGLAVHGCSFMDVARDVNTSVHVHVKARQASFEIPGSSICSRKRNRDSDTDRDNTLRIVKRRRFELRSVLTCGSSYQLHAARHSDRAVVVKVFEGPQAEEHFAVNLTSSCRRLLHPNVGQMIGRSPDDEETPYIIYRGVGPINRLHPLIATALRTDLHRTIYLAMTTVKGLAAGIEYLNRQRFPLQSSLSPSQQILDILVGDNDEPLIVVNPAVAMLDDSVPNYDGDHGRAVFSSLCRETFKEANAILYHDAPERDHVNYESSSRPETPTIRNTTTESTENEDLELASPSTQTLARPNKTRRELWWIDPNNTCSLVSIARCFDNFLRSIPSSSSSPFRRLYNSKTRSVHRCPGYLREEILLVSDLAKSAIISHSTPNTMERCLVCGELVSSRAGSEEAKRHRKKEKRKRYRDRKKQNALLKELQLDGGGFNATTEPNYASTSSLPPVPVPATTSSFWRARPAIHIATMQRSVSVTPPPTSPVLLPSTPDSTPGPSISSSTSRTSSKRPYTPDDGEDFGSQHHSVVSAPPQPRKRRAAVKKGWKGWVEGSPPPSENLINLDAVPVLQERRTRYGSRGSFIKVVCPHCRKPWRVHPSGRVFGYDGLCTRCLCGLQVLH